MNRCNSPNSNIIPYGHVKISALDGALVGIGDFVLFELDGASTLGRIIDACMLDNIPVAELAQSISDDDEQDEKRSSHLYIFGALWIPQTGDMSDLPWKKITLCVAFLRYLKAGQPSGLTQMTY